MEWLAPSRAFSSSPGAAERLYSTLASLLTTTVLDDLSLLTLLGLVTSPQFLHPEIISRRITHRSLGSSDHSAITASFALAATRVNARSGGPRASQLQMTSR